MLAFFFFKVNVESSRNCIVYLFTNHVKYSNFGQKSWNTSVTSFLLSLFLTFGIHFASLIVGFAFNCVLVLIFSRHIRPSVLFTLLMILGRRICLAISSFLNWRPFRLFSWPLYWIKNYPLGRNQKPVTYSSKMVNLIFYWLLVRIGCSTQTNLFILKSVIWKLSPSLP